MKLSLMGDRELFHHYAGVMEDLLSYFDSTLVPSYDRSQLLKQLNYHESPHGLLALLRNHREEIDSNSRASHSQHLEQVVLASNEYIRRVSAVTPQHVLAIKALSDLQALIAFVFMEPELDPLASFPEEISQHLINDLRDYLVASVRLGLSDTSEVRESLQRWLPGLLRLDLSTDDAVRSLVKDLEEISDTLMVDELFSSTI